MTTAGIVALIIVAVLFLIIFIVVLSSFRVVRQTENFIIERFGKYLTTWSTGIHFLCPFTDRIVKKVSLKEQMRFTEREENMIVVAVDILSSLLVM